MIKLAEATIDNVDIDQLIEWLKTYPRLTKGPLTPEYEKKWSEFLGTKYSTFVNSGSSANLLMLATLMEAGKLEVGDAVIVPALSWATDLAPVIQLGLRPLLCDCNLKDYSYNHRLFMKLVNDGVVIEESPGIRVRHYPKAAIVVPVLGYIPDMDFILNACWDNKILLLEDCCEALGSVYEGQKLGTFGEMSTFSTYSGHHISTIEGGMVCTSNPEYDKILKSIRSHGWDRDWSDEDKCAAKKEWGVSEFDSLYTFYHCGFNMRATDLQAFLGIKQLDKLKDIVRIRNENFKKYKKYLGFNITSDSEGISNFAFPIVSKNRQKIVEILQKNNVEVRPLICGSMGQQPFFIKRYGKQSFRNADKLRREGMYIPNHHLLSEKDIKFIAELIKDLI